MPISENEYREPKFIKMLGRYPMTYDKKAMFTDTIVNPRVYVGRSVGGAGWKAPGYNPNHNSTTTERVALTNDSPSFKPY